MKKTVFIMAIMLILSAFSVSAAEKDVINPYTDSRVIEYDVQRGKNCRSDFLIEFNGDDILDKVHASRFVAIRLESLSGTHEVTIKLKDAKNNEVVYKSAKGRVHVGAYHINESNNFERNEISPLPGMTHIGYVELNEGQTEINVQFTKTTAPFSLYYISLYKIDLDESADDGYMVKYMGALSPKGFSFKGLESGCVYRVSLSSVINRETVHGIICAG